MRRTENTIIARFPVGSGRPPTQSTPVTPARLNTSVSGYVNGVEVAVSNTDFRQLPAKTDFYDVPGDTRASY